MECKFVLKLGTGEKCGKRHLRGDERKEVAEMLQKQPVELFRAQLGNEFTKHSGPEPPYLYSSSVLHKAKSQQKLSSYLEKDPIEALVNMKFKKHLNSIHDIGKSPFFIHFWNNSQIQIWNKIPAGRRSVIIDSSGSKCEKINNPHDQYQRSIFLYLLVVNYENLESDKQFPVAQMLSESHRTEDIRSFLNKWILSGAKIPNEVICDENRALLNAVVLSFCNNYASIRDYAHTFTRENLSNVRTRIRIDVAHFIKKYSGLLKDTRPRIKSFYLAVIGQLIICKDENDAKGILRALFIVSETETCGLIEGTTTTTTCSLELRKLKFLVTGNIKF